MKIALPVWLWSGAAFAADLEPRVPLAPMSPIAIPTGQAPTNQTLRLGVKFVDDARAACPLAPVHPSSSSARSRRLHRHTTSHSRHESNTRPQFSRSSKHGPPSAPDARSPIWRA